MRKQTIAILSILAVGTLFSIGYATSTSISDAGITTPSLTVNGNQIGEATYTNYNTIALNTTAGTSADVLINSVRIGNDGGILSQGKTRDLYVALNGTKLFDHASAGINSYDGYISQSETGKYKVIMNADGNGVVSVYNNGQFVKNLGINLSQFATGSINQPAGIAISPDGKYIVVIGEDSGLTTDRIIVFQGS